MVKNPTACAGHIRDAGSIPGSGRSPGGGNGNPVQYSCLENPAEEPGELQSIGLQKSWTQLKRLNMHANKRTAYLIGKPETRSHNKHL